MDIPNNFKDLIQIVIDVRGIVAICGQWLLHCRAEGVWKISARLSIHRAHGYKSLFFCVIFCFTEATASWSTEINALFTRRNVYLSVETAPFRPRHQWCQSTPHCTPGTARLDQITVTLKPHSSQLSTPRLTTHLRNSSYKRHYNCQLSASRLFQSTGKTHVSRNFNCKHVPPPTSASGSQVRSPVRGGDTGDAACCTDTDAAKPPRFQRASKASYAEITRFGHQMAWW